MKGHKKTKALNLIVLWGILLVFTAKTYSQTTFSKTETMPSTQKPDTSAQILIDRFIVPKNARQEFTERMNINRNFIKTLPGFIEDNVYERIDEQGSFIYVTIAVWENEVAIKKAKELVQGEYKKEGFNLREMLKRLNIVIDRGVYKKTEK